MCCIGAIVLPNKWRVSLSDSQTVVCSYSRNTLLPHLWPLHCGWHSIWSLCKISLTKWPTSLSLFLPLGGLSLVKFWCVLVGILYRKQTLSLVRFWCLFVSKKTPNDAVKSQSAVVLMVLGAGRVPRPEPWVQLHFVTSQHCLESFWRQTNIKISWDLVVCFLKILKP